MLKLIKLLICIIIFMPNISYAEDVQIFKAHGIYILSKYDTLDTAEQNALKEAKRNAVEQAGTYLESLTIVDNSQVVYDDIFVLASNIISINEKKFYQEIKNDQIVIHCDITAEIDIDNIKSQLKDKQLHLLVTEYRKLQEKNRNLTLQKDVTNQIPYNEAKVQEIKNEAEKLKFAGCYVEAIDKYTEALQYKPNSKDLILQRGLCYYYIEQYSIAIVDLNNAGEIELSYPGASTIYTIRGILNESIGNIDSSLKDLTYAVILDNTNAMQIRMTINFKYQHYQEAIDDAFLYLAKANPNDPTYIKQIANIYMVIAMSYYQLNNQELYNKFYQKALEHGYK